MVIWMSHGDSVIRMPDGFQRLGHTENAPITAMADKKRKCYAVQFHPEVSHTARGQEIIQNFLYNICGCQPNWTSSSFIETTINNIKKEVKNDKVLCALSGGVDSTTVAGLLQKAIGDNLTCMYIDQGFMRIILALKMHSIISRLEMGGWGTMLLQFLLIKMIKHDNLIVHDGYLDNPIKILDPIKDFLSNP